MAHVIQHNSSSCHEILPKLAFGLPSARVRTPGFLLSDCNTRDALLLVCYVVELDWSIHFPCDVIYVIIQQRTVRSLNVGRRFTDTDHERRIVGFTPKYTLWPYGCLQTEEW